MNYLCGKSAYLLVVSPKSDSKPLETVGKCAILYGDMEVCRDEREPSENQAIKAHRIVAARNRRATPAFHQRNMQPAKYNGNLVRKAHISQGHRPFE